MVDPLGDRFKGLQKTFQGKFKSVLLKSVCRDDIEVTLNALQRRFTMEPCWNDILGEKDNGNEVHRRIKNHCQYYYVFA